MLLGWGCWFRRTVWPVKLGMYRPMRVSCGIIGRPLTLRTTAVAPASAWHRAATPHTAHDGSTARRTAVPRPPRNTAAQRHSGTSNRARSHVGRQAHRRLRSGTFQARRADRGACRARATRPRGRRRPDRRRCEGGGRTDRHGDPGHVCVGGPVGCTWATRCATAPGERQRCLRRALGRRPPRRAGRTAWASGARFVQEGHLPGMTPAARVGAAGERSADGAGDGARRAAPPRLFRSRTDALSGGIDAGVVRSGRAGTSEPAPSRSAPSRRRAGADAEVTVGRSGVGSGADTGRRRPVSGALTGPWRAYGPARGGTGTPGSAPSCGRPRPCGVGRRARRTAGSANGGAGRAWEGRGGVGPGRERIGGRAESGDRTRTAGQAPCPAALAGQLFAQAFPNAGFSRPTTSSELPHRLRPRSTGI